MLRDRYYAESPDIQRIYRGVQAGGSIAGPDALYTFRACWVPNSTNPYALAELLGHRYVGGLGDLQIKGLRLRRSGLNGFDL